MEKITINTYTSQQLKEELERRGISTAGNKNELFKRLQDAVSDEMSSNLILEADHIPVTPTLVVESTSQPIRESASAAEEKIDVIEVAAEEIKKLESLPDSAANRLRIAIFLEIQNIQRFLDEQRQLRQKWSTQIQQDDEIKRPMITDLTAKDYENSLTVDGLMDQEPCTSTLNIEDTNSIASSNNAECEEIGKVVYTQSETSNADVVDAECLQSSNGRILGTSGSDISCNSEMPRWSCVDVLLKVNESNEWRKCSRELTPKSGVSRSKQNVPKIPRTGMKVMRAHSVINGVPHKVHGVWTKGRPVVRTYSKNPDSYVAKKNRGNSIRLRMACDIKVRTMQWIVIDRGRYIYERAARGSIANDSEQIEEQVVMSACINQFREGELVLLSKPMKRRGKLKSLHPYWVSPCRTVQRINDKIYRIQLCAGSRRRVAHKKKLVHYITEVIDVSVRDEQN